MPPPGGASHVPEGKPQKLPGVLGLPLHGGHGLLRFLGGVSQALQGQQRILYGVVPHDLRGGRVIDFRAEHPASLTTRTVKIRDILGHTGDSDT